MSEAPFDLSLAADGEGFVLSRTGDDGVTTTISLTPADILSLTRSALELREKSLSARQPASGAVEAVLASPVREATLAREMLGDHVLLTLTGPDGDHASFALPIDIAADVSTRLSALLESAPPTLSRQ